MRDPGARVIVPFAVLAIACALGFVLLAAVVARQGSVGFDEPVTALVKGLPIPTDAWRMITELGAGLVLFPVGAGLVAWLLLRRRPADALVVAVALIAATLLTDAVKDYVARPRPPGPHLTPADGYSFPSGHTLNSTATYGLLALYLWRSRVRAWGRRIGATILVAIPFMVGLSRIALGVHYPSDVLGGWLAGTAFAAAVGMLGWPPADAASSPGSAAGPGSPAPPSGPQ